MGICVLILLPADSPIDLDPFYETQCSGSICRYHIYKRGGRKGGTREQPIRSAYGKYLPQSTNILISQVV